MKYPFLPDFHAAFLVKAGASMRVAMFVPGLLLFISFVALLFLANRRIFAASRTVYANHAALLSVALVVFAGGFSGILTVLDAGVSAVVEGRLDPIGDVPGAPGRWVQPAGDTNRVIRTLRCAHACAWSASCAAACVFLQLSESLSWNMLARSLCCAARAPV